LPDSPAPRDGEVSFAAFGKSDCQHPEPTCPEPTGSNLTSDVQAQAITKQLLDQVKRGGLDFSLFTGDVDVAAGREPGTTNPPSTPADSSYVHHRWTELVANPLADARL